MLRLILIIIALTIPIYAQSQLNSASSYKLEADEVYGRDNESFTANGNVVVSHENSVITADTATFYPAERRLEARGNVVLKDNNEELRAESIVYNLDNSSGNMKGVSGVLNGEYFICARELERTDEDYFIMDDVRVTTCIGDVPDWSFQFHRASAKIDGYLVGDHTTANIKDVPILYLPKFIYPLGTTRKTGLLIPNLGYQSDYGVYFMENFFWAIDYDKDMTLGLNNFSSRGAQGLAEYRQALSSNSYIYLAGEALSDKKDDIYESNRWRYVSKSVINITDDLQLLFDAEQVSDYMYMRDYGSFGIYESDMTNNINVFGEQYHFLWRTVLGDFKVMYKDDLVYNDQSNGFRKTAVTMNPSISLDNYGVNIGPLQAAYNLSWINATYKDYTYRLAGANTMNREEYNRLYLDMELYKTLTTPIFSITPYVKGYYTYWNDFSDDPMLDNDFSKSISYIDKTGDGYQRVLPEFGALFALNELYAYHFGGKHGIINEIQYKFIEDLNQDGLPYYLDNDIIDGEHSISWILKNYYSNDYFSMDLHLEQGIDLSSGNHFLPLEIRSVFSSGAVRNRMDMELDHNNSTESGNSVISFEDVLSVAINERFRVHGKYAYVRSANPNAMNTSVEIGGSYRFSQFEIAAYHEWRGSGDSLGFNNLMPMESEIIGIWHDQCWSLGLGLSTSKYIENTSSGRDMKRDYGIDLMVSLKGFGSSALRAFKSTDYYD